MVRVPRPVPGCDVKSLPLRTDEAYLLSRIDSVVSERELALITGMSQAEVTTALDRLFVLGAIDFSEPKAPVSRRGGASGSIIPPSRSFDPPPSRRFEAQAEQAPASRRSYDQLSDLPPPTRRSLEMMSERRSHEPPAERRGLDLGPETPPPPSRRGIEMPVEHPRIVDPDLEEPADLDHQKKKKILDLYNALDDRTHYELLGVLADADKKQIKAAYYALAPEYHPDKYFRKRLGTYKQKIEAIFTRLTLAHDVLTSKQRRAEYDAYLEQTRRNRTMAALLEHDPSDVSAVVAASEEGPPSGSMSGRYMDTDASGPESRRRPPYAPRITQATRPRPGEGPGAATSAAPATPPVQAGHGDAGRPRFDPHRRMQLERYVLAAKVALERKDLAAAANAYRLAVGLAPEDTELKQKLAEVQQQAASELAEGFLKQAEYEASQGRWAEAALSYANVCPGRPDDPRPHERVAFCTLKTGQNTRRAIDYARRAVRLAPQSAEYRLTLARAYMTAGLETSARVEMERAAELAPNDARMREAIAQLRVQMKRTDSSEQ
ncbi:J domain-containing protein [Polyangium aurulentum]|uniref:J domain-containing protein n=1 Tax=Polyangium aurulentum TaxID=2567896 RepID=UPI001F1976AF|nr:J domain-containing protein [Polyangium aurulentum]